MNIAKLYELFKSPGVEYRGKPFWSWNGELKKDELIRQVEIMGEMGFGGYFMHSRCGLITEYLGDEWFELINAVADAGEKAGLENWLYDEDRWPSGSAGGKASEEMKYRMKSVYLYEISPEDFQWTEDIMRAFAAKVLPDGISISGYAEIISENQLPAWESLKDAEGEARVLVFKVVYDTPSSNYNGNTYIDTMNAEAVRHFIDLTHEEYLKRCGDRFGRTIKGIFTDEPHRGHAMDNFSEKDGVRSSAIFYTDDIFEEFESRYGYDAAALLPEIFYRLNGDPVSKVRIDYFDLGCDLFCERFMKQINDWCEAHDHVLTGHLLHEDLLCYQTVPCGSLMRGYQYMGNPGIDLLGNNNYSYWVAKQCASVVRQFGKKWMLSEMYGVSGWEFPLRGHKRLGDWQALFGVNVRCPHLAWYTMEGECKRDYPASTSYQSPYWKDYSLVETYFARFGAMMSTGTPVCDLLVLEPVESMWALSHLKWAKWIRSLDEDAHALEEVYQKTFHQLAGRRIDFDYGEEQIMARNYRIEGGKLCIGHGSYSSVLVSGALTIRESTVRILREFLEAGGRVVFAGELPGYVGGVHSDACSRLISEYENAVQIDLESIGACMAETEVSPITSDACSAVFNQVRTDGVDYISAWLNTDGDRPTGEFTVTAALPEDYRAEIWELETGARYIYPSVLADGVHTLKCSMEAAGTMVLVFTKNTDSLPVYSAALPDITGELTAGVFELELDEPNVLVLDYVRYMLDDDAGFSELREVLKTDQAVRDRVGIEYRGGEMLQPWFAKKMCNEAYGKLTLEYPFIVETIPEGTVWLAGERPELNEYFCNGVKLNAAGGWWVDNAFEKMEIPAGVLKPGKNTITVVTDFRRTTNIEAVYILGSFGVSPCAGKSAITALSMTAGLDDMAQHSLPFYGGRATIIIAPEQYMPRVNPDAERILMQVPECSGALASVQVCGRSIPLAWEPYTADITEAVKQKQPIRVTLVNTRRNTFGPLHIVPVRLDGYGPGEFVTSGERWHDEYSFIEASVGRIIFRS
ncbi:MAG: hypothetical protein IKM02_05085 [Clostridia bacterium]|nr:hypothetical protein [Clostridia bacterium]